MRSKPSTIIDIIMKMICPGAICCGEENCHHYNIHDRDSWCYGSCDNNKECQGCIPHKITNITINEDGSYDNK